MAAITSAVPGKPHPSKSRRGVRYPLSVRLDAVQRVQALRNAGLKIHEAVEMVAVSIGCSRQTLGNWVRSIQRRQQPEQSQRVMRQQYAAKRLAALEREVQQLRSANVELHRIIETAHAAAMRDLSVDCSSGASSSDDTKHHL